MLNGYGMTEEFLEFYLKNLPIQNANSHHNEAFAYRLSAKLTSQLRPPPPLIGEIGVEAVRECDFIL